MQYLSRIAAGLAVILLLAACSHGPAKPVQVDEMKDPGTGMLYGQIRFPNKDWHDVRLVLIQKVGKVYAGMGLKGLGERVHITPDGRFIAANLAPGKYMLGGYVVGSERHFLGKAALNYTVDVTAGGLHYLGTYNYVGVRGSNMMRPGEFRLEPDRSPASHAELLTWVEEGTRNTKWHAGVQRRLTQLRKDLPKGKS
jgi:hypothetical protein